MSRTSKKRRAPLLTRVIDAVLLHLEEDEREYLFAVVHHECGPVTSREMEISETLQKRRLLNQLSDGDHATVLGQRVIAAYVAREVARGA